MSAAAIQPPALRYAPTETLAAFQARQRAAFQAGKAAWRAGQINGQALQLYETLVRYVGMNHFAWVKELTLVEELGRSKSTIVRWMQQLVGAGLIRRPRRFGASSLTYITAYDIDDSDSDDLDDAPADEHTSDEARPTPEVEADQPALADSSPAAAPDDQLAPAAASFFGRTSEPSINPFSRRDLIKNPQLNPGGGGIAAGSQNAGVEATAATTRLQQEGVLSPQVLAELHEHSLADIEATIRYVARCRTRDDPRRPGLIVHLIRRGFRACRQPRTDDGHRRPSERHASPEPEPPHGKVLPPADDPLASTWRQALELLEAQLDAQSYATWIAPTRLLHLDDDLAVVVTPNVFVRDEVERNHATHLEAAVRQVIGRPVAVELVIGTLPGTF
jgi:hypothetical protein